MSFARELEKCVVPKLKKWAGLFRGSDLGALFRRREHLGLQLTSIVYHYEHMQLVKYCLLENSKDPSVRSICHLRKSRVMEYAKRWSGAKELARIEPIATHNLQFSGQTGRSGLEKKVQC